MHEKNPSVWNLLHDDLLRQNTLLGGQTDRLGFLETMKGVVQPRFPPVFLYRLARAAFLSRIPVVPYVLTYLNMIIFGIQITPKCEIGGGLFLPHPVGTVIGAWRIGQNATIFQQVTLGAKRMDMAFTPSLLPELGDNVIVGAGAKVLGGIRLDDNVVVGANSVVLQSVKANTTVVGSPARVMAHSSTSL